MADTTQTPAPIPLWQRVDKVWLLILVIIAAILGLLPSDAPALLDKALSSFLSTAPFILFAVFLIAVLKATGAENLLAKAFQGPQPQMILFGALAGGLSPFCSCEVIPFIAALLAAGAPLSAVMAFWLSSPLMDPAMFTITAAALGLEFAVAKTVAAVGMGLLGGFGVMLLSRSRVFSNPLKARASGGCGSCCGSKAPFSEKPVWAFWREQMRLATFTATARENLLFLGKWLALAYLLEALMIRFIPASWIAQVLGNDGLGTILLSALVGAPAYLNGYAAVPLLDGLIDQGMNEGAALTFMLAGGVSSIPAAIAVWALVKPRVFAGYLGFALVGSVVAGMVWSAVA